jgi:hypothetical protein
LDDITTWANDRSPASPRVFWLTGQAGSGKTTIAYTIAQRFSDVDANHHTVLGANFRCSRQFQETQVQTRILPTIAYQLARKCKSYANALHVADKFDAVDHKVATQIQDFLVRPWQQSEAACPPELPPYLIVIDALDEIKDNGGSAETPSEAVAERWCRCEVSEETRGMTRLEGEFRLSLIRSLKLNIYTFVPLID